MPCPIPNHLVLTTSGCVNSLWQRNSLTSRIFGSSRYPDLSEAFEVWCFRSKAAKRRLNMESTVWVKVQVSNGSAKLHWICFHFSSKFLLKSRISLLANLLIELYKLGILFMVSFSFFASSSCGHLFCWLKWIERLESLLQLVKTFVLVILWPMENFQTVAFEEPLIVVRSAITPFQMPLSFLGETCAGRKPLGIWLSSVYAWVIPFYKVYFRMMYRYYWLAYLSLLWG